MLGPMNRGASPMKLAALPWLVTLQLSFARILDIDDGLTLTGKVVLHH